MTPNDISSSYTYLSCLTTFLFPDGRSICIQYAPKVMDVLKITPPFYYSYQCGSTILTYYIPIYMYSISLQILSHVVTFIFIIFSSTMKTKYSQWILKSFPGIYLPSHWNNNADQTILDSEKSIPLRLINPHQIISSVVNNIVLLLSFGLCSPLLCFYISLSICVQVCYWLIFIGRFVCFRIDALATSLSGLLFLHSHFFIMQTDHRKIEDPLLLLLDRQLHGANSSLVACKWPITLTSCFFATLLGWDMAGDQGGWFEALWVPIAGVMMLIAIWVWNRVLGILSVSDGAGFRLSFPHRFSSPLLRNNRPSDSTIAIAGSLEMIRSSLHQVPVGSVVQGGGLGLTTEEVRSSESAL